MTPTTGQRSGLIEFFWIDQDHRFHLRIGELRQLQEKCGERGPFEILNALETGRWRIDDVIQPIRLGLIGAGMPWEKAAKLVNSQAEHRPLGDLVIVAILVLQAAIVGVADHIDPIQRAKGAADPPGKGETAGEGSLSPSTTPTEPSSDGRPARSMN